MSPQRRVRPSIQNFGRVLPLFQNVLVVMGTFRDPTSGLWY